MCPHQGRSSTAGGRSDPSRIAGRLGVPSGKPVEFVLSTTPRCRQPGIGYLPELKPALDALVAKGFSVAPAPTDERSDPKSSTPSMESHSASFGWVSGTIFATG